MILIDVNILLYAANSRAPQHAAAREWLDETLTNTSGVGLPWPSLLGFLRLATAARIFRHPLSTAEAWTQVSQWLDCGPVWIPLPTAHLAALAIEHGLTLCSTDGDFARFPRLKWLNPLAR